MRKGFTLVELLAVMVVLSLLALIATPVVLEIIETVKESSTLRSADMYLSAVENSIMKQNMITAGSFNPDSCTIVFGNLDCDGTEVKVEVNGETPKDGSILRFEKGKIVEAKFVYENHTVIQNSSGVFELVVKFCKLDNDADSSNTITAGDKYICEVKDGTKYNFYVLTSPSNPSKEINLIMDRNICENGKPATETNTCLVEYNSSGDAEGTGPTTAITYLNNATSKWDNVPSLNLIYNDESGNFSNFQINGKARLAYKSEVSNYNSSNKTNAFLYDYLSQSGTIQTNSINGILGYWTLSTFSSSASNGGVVVGYSGSTMPFNVNDKYGIRPVIKITTDNIID